jgi:hypothetical protein
VHGDVEPAGRRRRSAGAGRRLGPGPRSGRPCSRACGVGPAPHHAGGEGRGSGRPYACCTCSPSAVWVPSSSGQAPGRRRAAASRAGRHVPLAQVQGRGGRPCTNSRSATRSVSPGECPRTAGRRRCGGAPAGAAVAGLVAATRSAGARLPRAHGSGRCLGGGGRCGCAGETSFPCRANTRRRATGGLPPVRPGRATRARWCGSGCSPPTSGRPGSRRSRARAREVGDAGLDDLGGVVRAPPSVTAISTPVSRLVHVTCMVPSARGAGVPHGVADQLADHEAGVVAGLVGRSEAAHPLHQLVFGRLRRSRG